MSVRFSSFGEMASFLSARLPAIVASEMRALEEIGRRVQAEVEDSIGHYQSPTPGIESFSAAGAQWEPLHASTLEKKQRLGQLGRRSADDPLYASGAFLAGVRVATHPSRRSVEVGTNKPYVRFTEYGTSRMAPRPVFAPAALRVMPHMMRLIGAYAIAGISGISIDATEAFIGGGRVSMFRSVVG